MKQGLGEVGGGGERAREPPGLGPSLCPSRFPAVIDRARPRVQALCQVLPGALYHLDNNTLSEGGLEVKVRRHATRRSLMYLWLFTESSLPTVPAPPAAGSEGGAGDLRCVCVKTTSAVHPRRISSLEVIGAGLHCPSPQLIATLKDGRKICLDPQNPLYKKIIKKLLKT
eukprot:bmy_19581T0